jgi:predicted MFS family arabinose efflux permease
VQDEASAATVRLAALGCGILVATIYYAQPLIDPISQAIGLSRAAAGLIVTVMQVGYGLGLACIVPLADRYENRFLVTASLGITAVALAAIGLARGPVTYLIPALVAGVACVGAQILVPMVAGMASPARRGRVIGLVMGGLLTGIMLARPAASFIASVLGWRGVFLVAAVATAGVCVALRLMLPRRMPEGRGSYLATLRSTARVVVRYGELRRRMAYQMLLFALFVGFWTTVPLMLADRFGFGQPDIALFALAGAGGALAAPVAGRIADRGYSRAATIAAALGAGAMLAATWPLARWGAGTLGAAVALAACAAVFDAFVQTNHVVSQRLIFALSDSERARLNAAYMTGIFFAGALASAFGPLLYANGGWGAISLVGVVLACPIPVAEALRRARGTSRQRQ